MKLAEPTTTLTDYILATETLVFALLLFRAYRLEGQLAVGLWAAGFMTTAMAGVTGGTFHGFVELSESTRTILWKCTVYCIGFSSLTLFSATIFASFRGTARNLLLTLSVIQFVIYAFWMITHDDFKYVIYNYAPTMLGILTVQILTFRVSGGSASWTIAGILVSFTAVGIQQSGIQLHKNFNYNDIYHVIQMGAMYLLYRGGLLLQDKK